MEKILFAPGLCQTMRVLHRAHELPVMMVANKPKSKILFLQSVYIDRIGVWVFIFICMFMFTDKCDLSLTGQIWELLFPSQLQGWAWNSLSMEFFVETKFTLSLNSFGSY